MTSDLIVQADRLWRTANQMLNDDGLLAIIEAVGPTVVVGSYAYGLMTRCDIDISLQIEDGHDVATVFALGERIANRYPVAKMTFSNHYIRDDLPFEHGLYWGVILPYDDAKWQVDIWAFAPEQYSDQITYSEFLRTHLAQIDRQTVLALKNALMQRGDYRVAVSSIGLYESVIAGVRTMAEFDAWWEAKQCAS